MNEMEIVKLAGQQVPNLVVLGFIVWVFLKHMNSRDAFIQRLHDEHMAARGESRDCIRDNTAASREVTEAIMGLKHTIREETNRSRTLQ